MTYEDHRKVLRDNLRDILTSYDKDVNSDTMAVKHCKALAIAEMLKVISGYEEALIERIYRNDWR